MTLLFSSDKNRAGPKCASQPTGPETRQRSSIWGVVVEAMLSQVGRVEEKEQDCRMECLLERARWPACLQQACTFHLRSSGFHIPAMHHRSHHAEEVDRTVQRFSIWSLGVQSDHLGSSYSNGEFFNLVKNTPKLGSHRQNVITWESVDYVWVYLRFARIYIHCFYRCTQAWTRLLAQLDKSKFKDSQRFSDISFRPSQIPICFPTLVTLCRLTLLQVQNKRCHGSKDPSTHHDQLLHEFRA